MPKSYCYLSQKTSLQLEQIKQDEGYDSTSQVMKEMIDLGIRVYMQNKDAANMSPEDKMRLEKEEELGLEIVRKVEREVYLQVLDTLWMQHL